MTTSRICNISGASHRMTYSEIWVSFTSVGCLWPGLIHPGCGLPVHEVITTNSAPLLHLCWPQYYPIHKTLIQFFPSCFHFSTYVGHSVTLYTWVSTHGLHLAQFFYLATRASSMAPPMLAAALTWSKCTCSSSGPILSLCLLLTSPSMLASVLPCSHK